MERPDIVPLKPAWTTTSAVTLAQPLMGVSDKGTADAAAAAATEERACNAEDAAGLARVVEGTAGLAGAEEPAACVTARPALNWRKTVPDVSTSMKKKALTALLPRLRPNSIYVKAHEFPDFDSYGSIDTYTRDHMDDKSTIEINRGIRYRELEYCKCVRSENSFLLAHQQRAETHTICGDFR